MNQDNQTTTIFDSITPIVSGICQRYNIPISEKDNLERVKKGKQPKAPLVVSMTKDFIQKNISDKDFVVLIKNNLEVSDDIASKISIDIKNSLVPVLKKILEYLEKNKKPDVEIAQNDIVKTHIGLPEMNSDLITPKEEENIDTVVSSPITTVSKKEPNIKKTITPPKMEEPAPKPKRAKGPDKYREPIE